MKKFGILFLMFAGLSAFAAGSAYKVEDIGGVPRITKDGEVVRARMLYVTPGGSAGDKISKEWKDIVFEFTSHIDAEPCSLHVRMDRMPSTLWFSQMKLEDLTENKVVKELDFSKEIEGNDISFWCEGKGRKDLPLVIKNEILPDAPNGAARMQTLKVDPSLKSYHGLFNNFKVKKHHKYKMSMRVKSDTDMKLFLTFRKQYDNFEFIGGSTNETLETQTKMAGDVGVDFVTFPVEPVWDENPTDEDFKIIKVIYDRLIAANPNVKMIPRIRFYPPTEWINANQEHMMKFSDGSISRKFTSIASELYRDASVKALKHLIDYSEKYYSANMAGYHPTGANSHEWFYGGTWDAALSGYDAQTLKAWRVWLTKKYRNDAALQAAWKRNVTLANAEVPNEQERRAKSYLLNPSNAQNVIDFNLFLQDDMVGIVNLLADKTREYAGSERLVLFFYGYGMEFSGVSNGPAFSGHYGLGKILKNKNIDIICGPISYLDRRFGEGKTTMGGTESILRAGKIWLDEDDTSTYLAPKQDGYPGIEPDLTTQENTIKVLRRNQAQEYVRNFASWWMDLGGGGWFSDTEFWKQKNIMKAAEIDMIKNPVEYAPEVALIFDEPSMCYVSGGRTSIETCGRSIRQARVDMNRSGIPFGHYLLSDVIAKKSPAKLNVFLAAYALDAKQRKKLASMSKKSFNIWMWAPGFIDIDKAEFSTDAVKELTDFDVKSVEGLKALAYPTDIGKSIGLPSSFGMNADFPILLSPEVKDGDVVLAKYSNGDAAVVLRGKNLFCGVTGLNVPLLHYMANQAGVHIYTKEPAAVYANGKYVSITATQDGPYEFKLGNKGEIFDIFNDKIIGKGPILNMNLKRGDTLFLRLD